MPRGAEPQQDREPLASTSPSRRTMLALFAGAFAWGTGASAVVLDVVLPGLRPGARAAPPPPARAAATPEPVALSMEEEPLSPDTYLPPAAGRHAPLARAPVAGGPAAAGPVAPSSGGETVAPPPVRVVDTTPTWRRYARPLVEARGHPIVAVVIDDLGLDQRRTEHAVALDANLTLAFLTYSKHPRRWAARAAAARHELLVHVPMQPESARFNPGPNALLTSLSPEEIRSRLRWGLGRLDGYLGANNHMGSQFTEDAAGMGVVMDELSSRGLAFIDSRTTAKTVCGAVAEARAIPFASRNVFLDNHRTAANLRRQLAKLERVARHHGSAIGIGHPHDVTLTALAAWVPAARRRGIEVVPISSVLRQLPG